MDILKAKVSDSQELADYLNEHCKRAQDARAIQLETDYPNWDKIYRAIPAKGVRDIPWRNSSNYVVPVVRMLVDQFVARTLNVVFSARPLVQVHGGEAGMRDALEAYLNIKAQRQWGCYDLFRGTLYRGNKYGTGMVKVPWVTSFQNLATQEMGQVLGREIEVYNGPKPAHVAFDDWFLYPITANTLEEAEVVFHRVRYAEEEARRRVREEKWSLSKEELDEALHEPEDRKRDLEQVDAGVDDYKYKELHVFECHLQWDEFRVVAELEPRTRKILRAYHDPYPAGCNLFHAYRPFPRDDMFPGESACDILGQAQEEISSIHNERRNLSFLSAAPQFIVKDGARVPNATTGFYPGKVWKVDEMDDFRIEQIRAGYQDMMAEEQQVLMLAQSVFGVGLPHMGSSQGQMGKGGVYNTAGTLAQMAETNQRQSTNIRDFRLFGGGVLRDCFLLQKAFQPEDPVIRQLPQKQQAAVAQAMQLPDEAMADMQFEIRMSDSAANKEVEKANLMMAANIFSQYGQQAQGLVTMMHQQNPVLQNLGQGMAALQYAMGREMAQALELEDVAEYLPNVAEIFQQVQAQQHAQQRPNGVAMGPTGVPGQQ